MDGERIFEAGYNSLVDVLGITKSNEKFSLKDFFELIVNFSEVRYPISLDRLFIMKIFPDDRTFWARRKIQSPVFKVPYMLIDDHSMSLLTIFKQKIDSAIYSRIVEIISNTDGAVWLGSYVHNGVVNSDDLDCCQGEESNPLHFLGIPYYGKKGHVYNVIAPGEINYEENNDRTCPFRADLFYIPTATLVGRFFMKYFNKAISKRDKARLKFWVFDDAIRDFLFPYGYVLALFYTQELQRLSMIIIPVHFHWLILSPFAWEESPTLGFIIERFFPSPFSKNENIRIFWNVAIAGTREIMITPLLNALGHLQSGLLANVVVDRKDKNSMKVGFYRLAIDMLSICNVRKEVRQLGLKKKLSPEEKLKILQTIYNYVSKNRKYEFKYLLSLQNFENKYFMYKANNFGMVCISPYKNEFYLVKFPKISVWTQAGVSVYEKSSKRTYHYLNVAFNSVFVYNNFVTSKDK